MARASLLDLLGAFGCRPGLAGAAWSRATPNCGSTLAGPPKVGFADTTRGSTLAETPGLGFADNESAEFDAGIEPDTCDKGSFFSPLGVTVEELSTPGRQLKGASGSLGAIGAPVSRDGTNGLDGSVTLRVSSEGSPLRVTVEELSATGGRARASLGATGALVSRTGTNGLDGSVKLRVGSKGSPPQRGSTGVTSAGKIAGASARSPSGIGGGDRKRTRTGASDGLSLVPTRAIRDK